MEYDVVIIGAGAAGLIAARDLARAGCTVALLEARDRLGGRMLEVESARALAPIELGAEFVHGRPDITYALLREAGSTVVDNGETSFARRDGNLRRIEDDPFDAAAAFLAKALEHDEDRSVETLIGEEATTPAAREAGAWVRRLVSGFDAADPSRASARAVAREWMGDASADGAQSRPLGGYGPLVAHLARSLDRRRVDVRHACVVTRVELETATVRIDARLHGRTATFRARRAIVTVPHGVLVAPADAEGAIAFDPPLPAATRAALDRIAMGPVVKVVLRFRAPFWESLNGHAWRDGAFFSGDGAFPTLWTQLPVRADTLTAWAGGLEAAALAGGSEREWTDVALACASDYFGDAAAVENAFECAYVHDWQRDPFARGAYSYVLVGGDGARAALAVPVAGSLWFAGEATASDGEGGTVAGALESGRRAARDILDQN